MKISELIEHLEAIKKSDGDLEVYDNRYRTAVSPSGKNAFAVAYLMNPTNKREVKKFWSEYVNDINDKAEKVLRVF